MYHLILIIALPMTGPLNFADLDKNGDGQISEQEFYAAHAKRAEMMSQGGMMVNQGMPSFSRFDLDRDGLITQKEFHSARKNRMDKGERFPKRPKFSDFDRNGDGEIAEDEFKKPAGTSIRFADLDADSNGVISREEFNQFNW